VTGVNCLAIGRSAAETSDPKIEVNSVPKIPLTVSNTPPAPEFTNWEPIAHFVIKPNNIFVGNPNDDHRKPERVVHKLGDFGMARHIPTSLNRGFQGTHTAVEQLATSRQYIVPSPSSGSG